MNELAQSLNTQIQAENPYIFDLLSDLGKSLYFPKGILTQAAESKQKAFRFDATIGIATEKGSPMYLPIIQDTLSAYNPEDIYPYAPPAGKPQLRQAWREKILRENPSLQGNFGNPIVTNALTHGLSVVADMFANEGDPLIVPDKLWGNYRLIFGVRRGAKVVTFPLFNDAGNFNVSALKQALQAEKKHGKALLLLNFPNNPTGYTPNKAEAEAITKCIKEVAEEGLNLVVISDDAYFGLFYEDSIQESIFAHIANIHPRVLSIKVDGATKEDYVWGFRVGFLTFASKSAAVLDALENKALGIMRGTISSSSHPAQTFVLHALSSPEFKKQKQLKYDILQQRAMKVKQVLAEERYQHVWEYYPFNSGYFMCLKLKNANAEKLRKHLLEKYGVGVISTGPSDIRIAFSCLEEENIPELFDLIYQGIKDLDPN